MASAGARNWEASIKRPTSSATNLPKDILIDILLRLPVLFLVRFRCVCKSWCTLFDNPEFIKMHLNRRALTKNKGGCLLLKHGFGFIDGVYSLRNSTTFDEVGKLEVPVPSKTGYYNIVECCHGLICLVESSHRGSINRMNAILWNPAIREYKVICSKDDRIDSFSNPYAVVGLGFVFHPIIDDYKMVRFVYYFKAKMCEVEVYSLRMDSWKKIKDTTNILNDRFCIYNCFSQAFVNGALHWMVNKMCRQNYCTRDLILSFDIGEDKFKEIMLPSFNYHYGELEFQKSLTMFRESLSMLVYHPFKMNENCDIWVMKEHGVGDSWTILYTITLGVESFVPLGLFNNDETIFLENRDGKLVSCNVKDNQMKNLRVIWPDRIVEYTESLVSVRGRKEQLCGAA